MMIIAKPGNGVNVKSGMEQSVETNESPGKVVQEENPQVVLLPPNEETLAPF